MIMPTFHVRGTLSAASGRPMHGYSVIAESGIRDESSPLCLEGIRAGEWVTDSEGRFQATFFTTGASVREHDATPIPKVVEVHIQFSPGRWRCRDVVIRPDQVTEVKGREVWMDLGQIAVEYDACRAPVRREEE